MKKSLTATIAMAKQPNETMTQALHRLKNSGESITQTAARLAKGDIEADVITAPDNPITATGSETKDDQVKATLTPVSEPLKVNIEATASVEKATKPKAKPVAKKKTTTAKSKAKTTTKKKTTTKDN